MTSLWFLFSFFWIGDSGGNTYDNFIFEYSRPSFLERMMSECILVTFMGTDTQMYTHI